MEDLKIQFVEAFKQRTKLFAVRIIKMVQLLPKSEEAKIIGRQLMRCTCSVAANYRAVNRARSPAEYAAKLGVVVEEADETLFWLEMLEETGIVEADKLKNVKQEADEILRIVSSAKNKSLISIGKGKQNNS